MQETFLLKKLVPFILRVLILMGFGALLIINLILLVFSVLHNNIFMIAVYFISMPLLMAVLLNMAAKCVTGVIFNDEGITLITLNNKNGTLIPYDNINELTHAYIKLKSPCIKNVIFIRKSIAIRHFSRESRDKMSQLFKAHQMSDK